MNTYYHQSTDKSIEEAKEIVIDHLKSIGFGVLYELDFKEKVKEKGFEITNDFIMMEVCNPAVASKILEQNISMGYVLPCKVVVYKENQVTNIGLLKPTVMVELIDSEYMEFAKEIEDKLKSVIDKSV